MQSEHGAGLGGPMVPFVGKRAQGIARKCDRGGRGNTLITSRYRLARFFCVNYQLCIRGVDEHASAHYVRCATSVVSSGEVNCDWCLDLLTGSTATSTKGPAGELVSANGDAEH